MIDLTSYMRMSIDQLVSKIRSKSMAILRIREYLFASKRITQFIIHVCHTIQIQCEDYFHSVTILLDKARKVQRSFLHHLQVSESEDFSISILCAPTKLRRNFAVLVLLHMTRQEPWYIKKRLLAVSS